jgi:hypothetical protein
LVFIGAYYCNQRHKRASGLAVVCPLTSYRKPYPFALPVTVGQVERAILVGQLKSVDWDGRKAELNSKAELGIINKGRQYIAVLLAPLSHPWPAPLAQMAPRLLHLLMRVHPAVFSGSTSALN